MLPQEPLVSLDPLMRAKDQVIEVHRVGAGPPRREARARAVSALSALGLAGAEARFPHASSGSMAQRAATAAERVVGAWARIADEPTRRLEPRVADEVATLPLTGMGETGGFLSSPMTSPWRAGSADGGSSCARERWWNGARRIRSSPPRGKPARGSCPRPIPNAGRQVAPQPGRNRRWWA